MFVVGITGGIGSGKSAVTDHLETLGITVVDADKVARVVVEPGTPGLAAIAEHFGEDILLADGRLDRAALRKIVFDNPDERKVLEGITHPRIRDEISRQLSEANSPYVVLSSPLLLESGQNTFADYVVVVDVPEEVQLTRTMARDNNSEALVKQIMAAQLDRKIRLSRADTSIMNDGSLDALYERVKKLHEDLLARAAAASGE
jgi:dephospho-CoA kinase